MWVFIYQIWLLYVAAANASYYVDLYEKVRKTKTVRGTRFVPVFTLCSLGWGFPFSGTIKNGRLAMETGWAIRYEVEDGVFRLTSASKSIAKKGNLKPL
jgi:pyruvate/2-oxoacid:ferredoxin oxidoreductase beta subunit